MGEALGALPPEWEALWVLGPLAECDKAVTAALSKLERLLGSDETISPEQVWWDGQMVGYSLSLNKNLRLSNQADWKDWRSLFPQVFPLAFSLRPTGEGSAVAAIESWADSFSLEAPVPSAFIPSHAYDVFVESGTLDTFLSPASASFEQWASLDLVRFEKELSQMVWSEETVAAWWRCSENWLRWSMGVSSHNEPRFGPGYLSPQKVQDVVVALASHAPPDVDLDKAVDMALLGLGVSKGIWGKPCRSNPLFSGNLNQAKLHWLRKLAGDDMAWDAVSMRCSFSNSVDANAVTWFSGLSEPVQIKVLDKALEERGSALSCGLTVETLAVNEAIPALYYACPAWPHWKSLLPELRRSRRAPSNLQGLEDRLRAEEREKQLEAVLPAAIPARPKPRF